MEEKMRMKEVNSVLPKEAVLRERLEKAIELLEAAQVCLNTIEGKLFSSLLSNYGDNCEDNCKECQGSDLEYMISLINKIASNLESSAAHINNRI